MKVDIQEISSFLSSHKGRLTDLKNGALDLKAKIEQFVGDSTIFAGRAASAMGAYLTEVHGTLLSAWANVIDTYLLTVDRFIVDFGVEVDGHDDAKMEGAYLWQVNRDLDAREMQYRDIHDEVVRFYNNYYEYFNHHCPKIDQLMEDIYEMRRVTNTEMDAMEALDHRYTTTVYPELDRLLDGIEAACQPNNWLDINPETGLLNYQPGDVFNADWFDNFRLSDAAVQALLDSFFNADGSLNMKAIRELLYRNVNHFSDVEWAALVRLFLSGNVSYEQMCELFSDGARDVATALSSKMMEAILANTIDYLKTGVDDPDQLADLERQFLLAQIMAFIGSIDPLYKIIYSEEGYHPSANGDMTLSLDFSKILEGIITTRYKVNFQTFAEEYRLSDLNGLLFDGLTKLLQDQGRREGKTEQFDWVAAGLLFLFDLLLMLTSPIPNLPGAEFSAWDVLTKLADLVNLIANTVNQDNELSAAQKSAFFWTMIAAIDLLGGSASYVEAENGFVLTGSYFATPEALIKLAGLQREFGMDAGRAYAILLDPEHKIYTKEEYDRVYNYLNKRNGDWIEYRNALGARYRASYTEIVNDFGQKYPGLKKMDSADTLPMEVLQAIIGGKYGEPIYE